MADARDVESPREKARRGIAAARKAVAAAAKVGGRAGVRKPLAVAGALAVKLERRSAWRQEFYRYARLHRVAEIRANGSPHLRIFRVLGLDRPAPTLKRFANVLDIGLRWNWSPAEMRRRIVKDGPDVILRDFTDGPRRKLRRRGVSVA